MSMSEYSADDLKKNGTNVAALLECLRGLNVQPDTCMMGDFYRFASIFRDAFCFNGGDEDWLVVVKKSNNNEPWEPNWLNHTDTCLEPDTYDLGDHVVYVGSHA